MSTSADVRVTGRVQGVFFRAACQERAGQLGVTGWVSNEPDGSVAGHFEGEADAVEALVAWCREWTAYARVDRVEDTEARPTEATTFEDRR
jgi:acylphosphatase